MKVSVLSITYNQEEFVAQALSSALMQEVSFPYEIVVGEDFSNDRTREIVLEFQKQHPDRIRVRLSDAATSERDRGRCLGGKTNFIQSLRDCRGEYVALLDGDDYWTDVHKLQKQVDFLDGHAEYALCFHDAKMLWENGAKGAETFCPPDQKETLTLEDLLAGNFIFSGSTMFRRGLFGELPEWFGTTTTGDWALQILNAQHGKIGYSSEVMAAYRIHGGSWWSTRPAGPRLLDQIKLLDTVNAYLGFRYDRLIKATQYKASSELAEMAYQQGDLIGAKTLLVKCLRLRLANYRLLTSRQTKRLLKLQNPGMYNLMRSLRNFVYPQRS